MDFILSTEMIDDILFAMENQQGRFVFDATKGFCVAIEDTACTHCKDTEEKPSFYDIPEWTSAHGFRLMEQFTAQVHNPQLRDQLRIALEQKKGVFRQYKTILKNYPHAEEQWHQFKERQMKAVVYEWYNSLRVQWGLEKVSFEEESEETDTLLLQDFSFGVKNVQSIKYELLQAFILKTDDCRGTEIPTGGNTDMYGKTAVCSALASLVHTLFPTGDLFTESSVITVYAGDELCALCLLCRMPQQPQCLMISLLRVLPEYRGLGIGKELLQRACCYAKQNKADLIFADLYIPLYFIPQLERNGFKQVGLLYVKSEY